MADFYSRAYGLQAVASHGTYVCNARERQVSISEGQANQLHYALFEIAEQSDWQAFVQRTAKLPTVDLSRYGELPIDARGVRDPDGHCMVFVHGIQPGSPGTGALPDAMSQHFALRTQRIVQMLSFYENILGFIVSDRVHDDQERLKACFLRTHDLHHTLALFGAPVTGFDHQSFETPSWNDLKLWADHMASERIEIVWGVGRHGPGNDVFFMVRDPDGNLAEISAEIEVCDPARPVGIWKHEERTLNLWGKAILRS
jgi:catechol 2,3-dioxygenase-like lactoylglutathione lyase family enzyme